MTSQQVDRKYYEAIRPGGIGEKLLVRARNVIYADFVRCCSPAARSTILDVGVSDVINDGANLVERLHPYPAQITAAGLGEAHEFKAAFPAVRYVRLEPDLPLPFADGSFDIATSNAVVEHLGSRAAQRRFIAELRRVARQVFVTVPNRYFPVEHHTAIPLAHLSDSLFRAACALTGKEKWSEEANLILMSKAALSELGGPSAQTGYTGIGLGPFSSNLYLHLGAE